MAEKHRQTKGGRQEGEVWLRQEGGRGVAEGGEEGEVWLAEMDSRGDIKGVWGMGRRGKSQAEIGRCR